MKRARLVSALTLTLAVALMAVMATPAGAAGSGGGVVNGTVNLNPGILGTTPTPQTYTFLPITLSGVFNNGTATAAGLITTSAVNGGTTGPGDTILGGAGFVGPFTFNSTTAVGTASGSCGSVGPPVVNAGTYTRTGSIVLVNLNACQLTINGASQGAIVVAVRAQFSPTSGNGIVTPITSANFAGQFNL